MIPGAPTARGRDEGRFRTSDANGALERRLGSRSRRNTYPIRRRCMRLPKRQERARFWELIRAGAVRAEAAVAAGVPVRTGKRWFVQAGGVPPPNVPRTSGRRCLSITQDEGIFVGVDR